MTLWQAKQALKNRIRETKADKDNHKDKEKYQYYLQGYLHALEMTKALLEIVEEDQQ